MLRYENSEWLFLLVLIPIIILGFILSVRWRKKAIEVFGQLKLVYKLMPMASEFKLRFKFILFAIAIGSLIIGIANPQIGSKMEEVKREGVDLMIAIDLSNSMLAEDLQPNRLMRAKQSISKLIDRLDGDRIGLIVFAGDAYVQLPITTDYSAAKLFLSTINTSIVPTQGTAIGKAIELSIKSFDLNNDQNIHQSLIQASIFSFAPLFHKVLLEVYQYQCVPRKQSITNQLILKYNHTPT